MKIIGSLILLVSLVMIILCGTIAIKGMIGITSEGVVYSSSSFAWIFMIEESHRACKLLHGTRYYK